MARPRVSCCAREKSATNSERRGNGAMTPPPPSSFSNSSIPSRNRSLPRRWIGKRALGNSSGSRKSPGTWVRSHLFCRGSSAWRAAAPCFLSSARRAPAQLPDLIRRTSWSRRRSSRWPLELRLRNRAQPGPITNRRRESISEKTRSFRPPRRSCSTWVRAPLVSFPGKNHALRVRGETHKFVRGETRLTKHSLILGESVGVAGSGRCQHIDSPGGRLLRADAVFVGNELQRGYAAILRKRCMHFVQ